MKKKEVDKMSLQILDICKNWNFTTCDNVMYSYITCSYMIHDISENILYFRINCISNSLPSNYNLHRLVVKIECKWTLCNKLISIDAHILSNCFVTLTQKCFTWMNDNIFVFIHKDIVDIVKNINRRNGSTNCSSTHHIQFIIKWKCKSTCSNFFHFI